MNRRTFLSLPVPRNLSGALLLQSWLLSAAAPFHRVRAPFYRAKIAGLVARLNSADRPEAEQAEQALARLLLPKYPRISAETGRLRMNGYHLPLADSRTALDPLRKTLQDGTDFARAAAARIFGSRKDARALPLILSALTAPSVCVRRGAAEGLVFFAHPTAVPALVLALQDVDVEVVHHAVQALGETAGDEAVSALLAFFPQTDPEMKSAALHALETSGDARALPLIRAALSDRSPTVRKSAKSVLGTFDLQRRHSQS